MPVDQERGNRNDNLQIVQSRICHRNAHRCRFNCSSAHAYSYVVGEAVAVSVTGTVMSEDDLF